MRVFELYDHVVLKQDSRLYGTVSRTNTESYEPLEDDLIIAHSTVPENVLQEFVINGIPPPGYVYVQFADETAGSSLVHEDDLVLTGRVFQIGDNVKEEGNPMIGAVVDVDETYTLDPVALSGPTHAEHARLYPAPPSIENCTPACKQTLSPHVFHPNPHALLYNVPSREVKKAQDVMKDDHIINRDFVGIVEDIESDIIIRLDGTDSEVILTASYGIYVPVPDFGKPLVSLPDFDGLKRPDPIIATNGYSSAVPIQEPRPGMFVIVERSRLKNGRWLKGFFTPNCPTTGRVIDVRAHELMVEWLCHKDPESQAASRLLTAELSIYDNIRTYKTPEELRPRKDVVIYDGESIPASKRPSQQRSNVFDPSVISRVQSNTGKGNEGLNVNPGQDLGLGYHVKFRDPTAAAVKYQGDPETGHGRFHRGLMEHRPDEFRIFAVSQTATVLWQDGTTTSAPSTSLRPYLLFETELAPTDIVLKRQGMRQRKVGDRRSLRTPTKPFNEMTFFEELHDLVSESVGVVQSVDQKERVAQVRWYKQPHIELRGTAQILSHDSCFGEMGDRVEDVSLYEIMAFPSLLRRRRAMCIIRNSEEPQRESRPDETRPQGPARPRTPPPPSTLGIGVSASNYFRNGSGSLIRDVDTSFLPEPRNDWVGEIVALGFDGSVTVRLGGTQPCRDVNVTADNIVAIIDDHYDYGGTVTDDMMDLDEGWEDDDSFYDDAEADPISETVEYEGGERMDNDSGDENWVSDEESETQDPDETQGPDVDDDTAMDDNHGHPPSATSQTRTRAILRTFLGSEEPPAFEVLERAPPPDQFGLLSPPATDVRRIAREQKILASTLPTGEIYVRTYESRIDLLRCLIIGPKDTAYEYAPFLIDLYLPPQFPDEPPVAHFHSWTHGMGRINPNLYEEGKICLSLLGTWQGKHESESWSDKATVLQVLVSLQGLVFVKNPFYNEAGFEGYERDNAYTLESQQYNEKAFVMSRGFLKHALTRPPGGLEDVLAWRYLARPDAASADAGGEGRTGTLLSLAIERTKKLLEKSEQARQADDDALMDGAGDSTNQMTAYLKRLSRGGIVMLRRIVGELEEEFTAALDSN